VHKRGSVFTNADVSGGMVVDFCDHTLSTDAMEKGNPRLEPDFEVCLKSKLMDRQS